MKLWVKIFIGLIAGTAIGSFLGEKALVLKPIGDLFLNAIKMMIIPLVFSSLISAISGFQDTKKLSRIGIKSFAWFLLTTLIAISIGLATALLIQPGTGSHWISTTPNPKPQTISIGETLMTIIPKNPIAAMASGNILQIIVFSLLFGTAIVLVGEKAKPITVFFSAVQAVMTKLTSLVMQTAPYGVFALMAVVSGTNGLSVLLHLMKLILSVGIACATHSLLIYGGLLLLVVRINPIQFFKNIAGVALVAFTTTSAAATLPITIECAQKKLGISNSLANFVLPIGATVCMNGTAIYQSITALFVAQFFGIHLALGQYLAIIVSTTLASLATGGISGGGFVMLGFILASAGLPIEGIALVAGIDRILDMIRTPTNVAGHCVIARLISKSEENYREP